MLKWARCEEVHKSESDKCIRKEKKRSKSFSDKGLGEFLKFFEKFWVGAKWCKT